MTTAQLIRIARKTTLSDWLGGVFVFGLTLAALVMTP